MTVEYVDAGEAINQGMLTSSPRNAPDVAMSVGYERLLDARSEAHNWLTYYGAYDGQRYSLLDEINTENVKSIGPTWIFQAGTAGMIAGASTYAFEATPLVVDGVMYVSGWDGWVWALNAKTGDPLWHKASQTGYAQALTDSYLESRGENLTAALQLGDERGGPEIHVAPTALTIIEPGTRMWAPPPGSRG